MSKDRELLKRFVNALEPITTSQVDFFYDSWEFNGDRLSGTNWGSLLLRLWQEAHNHLEANPE